MSSDCSTDYKPPYLLLWGRITDISENLRAAVESGDEGARDRAMLRTFAELTKAQTDAEELLLSQNE